MGILNATPDSFYDGGRYLDEAAVLERCEKMVADGVDIIDVGGYSSRPGAAHITEAEETSRVVRAIEAIKKRFPNIPLSIDTFRSAVAKAAVGEGACMVNDIAGGELDPQMHETVAKLDVPYIMMHMKGTPQTMKENTHYQDLIAEVVDYFLGKVVVLRNLGIKDLIIDPGFGFAKNIAQNYEILKNLNYFNALELPTLVGVSRKSMIYKLLNITPQEALSGTVAVNTIALINGAAILRVHDVKEAKQVVQLINYMEN